jgi:hypothetical protein
MYFKKNHDAGVAAGVAVTAAAPQMALLSLIHI